MPRLGRAWLDSGVGWRALGGSGSVPYGQGHGRHAKFSTQGAPEIWRKPAAALIPMVAQTDKPSEPALRSAQVVVS